MFHRRAKRNSVLGLFFVGSAGQDEHFKKTEGQIGKTQAFSPKRTRARTRREFHGRDAGLHRDGNSRRPLCAHRYSVCLLLPLAIGPKIICRTQFVHLHISEPTPGPRAHSDRRRLEPLGHGNAPWEQVGRVVCLSHSPSEIWPNTHSVFFPAVSGARKRKRQATAADPDSETTSPSDSNTSSTVDTSTSEGEDEKDFILPDYPSDELTSSESSDSEPEEAPAENLSTGWSERVTRVDTQFHGDHVGPQNIPDHINHESTALSFLELFLDADFWGLLCRQTNLRAEQVKQSKPASYYAKNFRPVAVSELRLQMEKCVIKSRYESYWQGAGHNFIAHTPGFREVMERDRFIALWGFLHLVDQTDKAMDKSNKIYKVRPMLDRMLPLFRRYYSPSQQLSLDEGMIPTKNRLAIKQNIRDKPARWGIKSFLLCEAKTSYILDAEIYTGRVRDRHWPLLGSAGSVVRHLVENSQVTNKNHMLFMDRFYNSFALFHMLKKELGVLAAGTVMPSRKHYPKELGRRLTERGRYEFRCRGALCAIAWKDRKPIHFLSNYHDPRRASTVNRRVGDRLAQLTAPQLVVDYTR